MRPSRTTRVLCGTAAAGILLLGGCAADPGSPAPTSTASAPAAPLGAASPAPPEQEVIGGGTVIETDGSVELCLGPVMESFPPQCAGIPVKGWSWDGLDGAESSGSVTWGAFAVTGTYDGEEFTVVTEPMSLALFDPMAWPDPTGGRTGATDDETLSGIQDELAGRLGDDGAHYLSSSIERGYLWVDVVWDDGTLQKAADAEFGEDVVVIRPALRVLEG